MIIFLGLSGVFVVLSFLGLVVVGSGSLSDPRTFLIGCLLFTTGRIRTSYSQIKSLQTPARRSRTSKGAVSIITEDPGLVIERICMEKWQDAYSDASSESSQDQGFKSATAGEVELIFSFLRWSLGTNGSAVRKL